ncbi:MAG: AAA family ATPase [Planctomycetota bacterium]
MPNVLRLAIVDPNDATRDAVKAALMGLDTVWLEAECSRYPFFTDVVEQTTPDVGFVSMDDDPEEALKLVEQLGQEKPDLALLVASASTDGAMILRAMRAGAKEFLTQPLKPEDLAAALQRVSRVKYGDGSKGGTGCKVIAVSGATGGVGATSLAVNLGCELASNPENSVVLLDLDLTLGDADVFLDTIPEYTLTDVSQNVTRLDFTLLKRSLTKHSTGLYLLPRPVQLDDARLVTAEDLQRVIGLLKATFSHLIIDVSKAFTEIDMLAMRFADEVLMVTQLDLPCLRNVVRLMLSFEQSGEVHEKMRIVVNRVGQGGAQISVKKAEETIGKEVFWQLPNDFRTMIEVRNNGVPLIEQAPKAAITQNIAQLAQALDGGEHAADSPAALAGKSRSWLGLFGANGKKAGSETPAAPE